MEASKIKVGSSYGWSGTTRAGRYSGTNGRAASAIRVRVVQALGVFTETRYAKIQELRTTHSVTQVDLYRGKQHYLVEQENGVRRICSAMNLVGTWADCEMAQAKAQEERAAYQARIEAKKAEANEAKARAEVVVANLKALGVERVYAQGATIQISVEDCEVLLDAVLKAVA